MDALILVKKRLGQIEKRRGQHPLQSTDKVHYILGNNFY